jgi:ABC-type molybdate transport system substrate-binding protein
MSGIKVLSTIGMRTVLEEVTPAFERQNGVTVTRLYDSSIALMKRIDAGETGDAAVFTAAAIDELIAQARRSPTSRRRTRSGKPCSRQNPSRARKQARAGSISPA